MRGAPPRRIPLALDLDLDSDSDSTSPSPISPFDDRIHPRKSPIGPPCEAGQPCFFLELWPTLLEAYYTSVDLTTQEKSKLQVYNRGTRIGKSYLSLISDRL
jgi:hypothetical protein